MKFCNAQTIFIFCLYIFWLYIRLNIFGSVFSWPELFSADKNSAAKPAIGYR